MNIKAIMIIALIILISLVALSNALHTYENGNITLEEHHDHEAEEHDSNHVEDVKHSYEQNETEEQTDVQEHTEAEEHTQE